MKWEMILRLIKSFILYDCLTPKDSIVSSLCNVVGWEGRIIFIVDTFDA